MSTPDPFSTPGRPPPDLLVCKTFYFVYSLGLACLIPFLPLLYAQWGLSATHVGAMGAIRFVIGFIAVLLWNGIADATKKHNVIHFVCLVCQASTYGHLINVSHAWPTIWFYVVFAECLSSPSTSLADAASGSMVRRWNVLRGLGEHDAGSASYGRQRMWGAVSWGFVAAPVMGAKIARGSPTTRERAPFVGWFVILLAAALLSTKLQHGTEGDADARAEKESEEELAEADESGTFSRVASAEDLHAPISASSIPSRLWSVVKQPSVAMKFFLFLMAGASMAITDIYLFLWLNECGGTPWLMGVALFCTCVTEVVIFYYGSWIKRTLSLDWCLILTPFAYFLRQVYYWALPYFGNAWAVLPVQFLHGITFGLYWSTSNDFIQDIAPRGLTASMMGLFGAVNSIGGLGGSTLGGLVYDKFGGGRLFLGIGLINFFLGSWFTVNKLRKDRGTPNQSDSIRYVKLENVDNEL